MVLAFIPMYFIAVAYAELNKAEPDCGTTFTWAARAFGTRIGWMGGWGIIIADIIVMANLSQIAGSYTFGLFGFDTLAASTFWTTVAGIIWIIVMTYICYRGIEVSRPHAVRAARDRGGHPDRRSRSSRWSRSTTAPRRAGSSRACRGSRPRG